MESIFKKWDEFRCCPMPPFRNVEWVFSASLQADRVVPGHDDIDEDVDRDQRRLRSTSTSRAEIRSQQPYRSMAIGCNMDTSRLQIT